MNKALELTLTMDVNGLSLNEQEMLRWAYENGYRTLETNYCLSETEQVGKFQVTGLTIRFSKP